MSDEQLFSVWISTAHFSDWDDPQTEVVPFGSMTMTEVKQLCDLALVRGLEVIIIRQADEP